MAKSKKVQIKAARAYESIANSLREFGYPDASAQMVEDTHKAMIAGDRAIPHGIVGVFAESQLKEVLELADIVP